MTDWIEEIRKRYAHYGPTKRLNPNTAVLHIRQLLEQLTVDRQARDALIISGELDKTTVLVALDCLASEDAEHPDEAARRAARDLLDRIGWMGSDGHYVERARDKSTRSSHD